MGRVKGGGGFKLRDAVVRSGRGNRDRAQDKPLFTNKNTRHPFCNITWDYFMMFHRGVTNSQTRMGVT